MASQIPIVPGITPEISFSSTNITLTYLAKLSTEELSKLKAVYESSLISSVVTRQYSTLISIYAFATTLFTATLAYLIPDRFANAKKVLTAVAVVSGITATLSAFTYLVQTIQIADYRYWHNVCVTFMNPPA